MKYCVPIFVFLFCSFVQAGTADNFSGDIMSLNYYAHEGMMRLEAESISSLSDNTANSNGGGSKVFYNNFNLGLSYGLVPRLRLAVSESLLWDQSAEGASNSSLSNGPSDPIINLAWRYLEAADTGLSGDISARVIPSIGAAIPANPSLNVTGNNLNGYSTLAAQSALFWRYSQNEISFTAFAGRHFQGQENGTDPSTTVSISPLWQYSFAVADRVHLSNRFFVGASVLFLQVGDTVRNGADGTQKVVSHDRTRTYSAEFAYRPEPYYCFVLGVSTVKSGSLVSQSNSTSFSRTESSTSGELYFFHQFRL